MAREVPNITRIGIRIATLERLNIPIDEIVEDLPIPKRSEKKANVDYRDNKHASSAELMHDQGFIPEDDWELLTGGKYGRRIEIDNVIAYATAEKFWKEFVLPNFAGLFKTANYNLSLEKVVYVTLPNLNLLNNLAERIGTIAAADEVAKIESEHADYDISTKGFIEEIEVIEKDRPHRYNRHVI
jgi:hypothetical protein